jgi:hypothetical protein
MEVSGYTHVQATLSHRKSCLSSYLSSGNWAGLRAGLDVMTSSQLLPVWLFISRTATLLTKLYHVFTSVWFWAFEIE